MTDDADAPPVLRMRSTLTRRDRERYLRGSCLAFCEALRAAAILEHGVALERWALVDADGRVHHALLADPVAGLAHDCRGTMRLDAAVIGAGSSIDGACSLRRSSLAELRAALPAGSPANARGDVRRHAHLSVDGDDA